MPKTTYRKKTINGKEYFFYRLRHENSSKPRDLYASSVKELEGKIKSARRELDYNIVNNKECFETFFSDWLFEVRFLKLKSATKEKYEGIFRNYIKDSDLSEIKMKNLKVRDIQSYYNKLSKEGKSRNCIKMLNKLVGACIRYAFDNDIIIKDFSKSVVLPKETEKDKLNKKDTVNPFTLEEQKQFIKAIKGHEHEMLFLTALNSGMRQGELLALTWDDIDLKNNSIRVNKNLSVVNEVTREGRGGSILEVQTPKTKNGIRTVDIPELLTKQLKQHKTKQSLDKLKVGGLYDNNNLVFCDSFGKYLPRRDLLDIYKKVLKDNDIKPRKFHDLRHTYATRLFELGENPKTVQELLGHGSLSITLDTYTHVLDSMKGKAISKLNDLYSSMGAE
ncbi:site-specific integrase [Clostridium sp.]|uniref:tyrosine-type recombinase/integrase n=1 Tax=Clostridium sp. TaxID=1506 RepID=UPI003216D7A1